MWLPSDTEKKVARAMCEADGKLPYESTTMASEPPTDVALVVCNWETYLPAARRFVAATRALTADV